MDIHTMHSILDNSVLTIMLKAWGLLIFIFNIEILLYKWIKPKKITLKNSFINLIELLKTNKLKTLVLLLGLIQVLLYFFLVILELKWDFIKIWWSIYDIVSWLFIYSLILFITKERRCLKI